MFGKKKCRHDWERIEMELPKEVEEWYEDGNNRWICHCRSIDERIETCYSFDVYDRVCLNCEEVRRDRSNFIISVYRDCKRKEEESKRRQEKANRILAKQKEFDMQLNWNRKWKI